MKFSYTILSLLLILPSIILIPVSQSSSGDLQKYWTDMEAEISKYVVAIKKAGNDHLKIAEASKDHEKAVRAIRKKHKAGLTEYYKSVYRQNDAKREAWQAALAKLKKEYQPKLGAYWAESKKMAKTYQENWNNLRSKYGAPLKEYEAKLSELDQRYW